MMTPRFIEVLFRAGCLTLSLLSILPAGKLSACDCGPNCQCGANCACGRWTDPPPQDPGAATVRKNQSTLSAQERQDFVDAVLQLKDKYHDGSSISIYDEYVHAHMMAMDSLRVHDLTVFFPWHRALVRNFELELQAINPNVTIPYWDFTVDNQPNSSLWDSDFMGGDGDPNADYSVVDGPFRQGQWQLYFDGPDLRRNLALFTDHLPSADDVATALQVPHYDTPSWDTGSDITQSFRNYMAGWNFPSGEAEMHNRIHAWVGGSMAQMTSPNDPVFYLAHSNLDRIWAQWEDLHGYDYPEEVPPPGVGLRDTMTPFGVTPEDVLDHHALGYRYDTEGGLSPGGGRGPKDSKTKTTKSQSGTQAAPPSAPAELAAWFRGLDANRDGQIGLDEWKAAGRSLAEFERMDLNNDGFLTLEEVRRYLSRTRKGS